MNGNLAGGSSLQVPDDILQQDVSKSNGADLKCEYMSKPHIRNESKRHERNSGQSKLSTL